jgi:glucose/arabinose dehydrogenase
MKTTVIELIGIVIIIAVGLLLLTANTNNQIQPPQSPSENTASQENQDISIIAQNLEIPWEIIILPNGDILTTERPGRLIKISPKTQVISEIQGVRHVGEGGLLGMALHPDFENNNYIYLYYTTQENNLTNKVSRFVLSENSLSQETVIIDNIPASQNHDGGRIAFGPDGMLYITTGDSSQASLAQDTKSLAGKILRINNDGSIPDDNPFGNEIYSYGHRNPQGLAWDNEGRLWATEHGPSGTQSGYDEINLIVKGGNFGWPEITGDQQKEDLISPVIQSGSTETWAPAGIVFLNNSLFFTGLRGQTLYKAEIISKDQLKLERLMSNEYGRLRAITKDNNGNLYLSTSNLDGRGSPKANDDKILKISSQYIEDNFF